MRPFQGGDDNNFELAQPSKPLKEILKEKLNEFLEVLKSPESVANSVLHSFAPLSSHEIKGCWTWAFLLWVLVASSCMFLALFQQFYTACTFTSVMIDANSFDPSQVIDGSMTMCASYINGAVACVLPGLNCSHYRDVHWKSDFCLDEVIYCHDALPCLIGQSYAFNNIVKYHHEMYMITGEKIPDSSGLQYSLNFQPAMSMNYVTCPDWSIALVNAMQVM